MGLGCVLALIVLTPGVVGYFLGYRAGQSNSSKEENE
jgi:hypothetical protein